MYLKYQPTHLSLTRWRIFILQRFQLISSAVKIIRIGINKSGVSSFPSRLRSPLREGGKCCDWHSVIPTEGEEHVEKYDGDVEENDQGKQGIWRIRNNTGVLNITIWPTRDDWVRSLSISRRWRWRKEVTEVWLGHPDTIPPLCLLRLTVAPSLSRLEQARPESACQISHYHLHLSLYLSPAPLNTHNRHNIITFTL